MTKPIDPERGRLEALRNRTENWRGWGPYVSERQWGAVREDYSENGDAWGYFTHDQARSRAYRWGEDGIAGFCDDRQLLCLSLALWNGKDPFLKERLFGLTNAQGNHGEDVKELYYYLDAKPRLQQDALQIPTRRLSVPTPCRRECAARLERQRIRADRYRPFR